MPVLFALALFGVGLVTQTAAGAAGSIPAAPSGVNEVVSSSGIIDSTCGAGLGSYGGTVYTTVQGAVNAATNGNTVYVCAGTYDESVSIATNLTLDGAQWSVPVGAGQDGARTDAADESTIDSATGPVTYGGSGVTGTLDGFTLSGSGGAGTAAISAHADGEGYQWDNDILTANQEGINFNTADGASPSTISNDRFINNNAPGSTQGTGIFLTDGPADNLTISDNSFTEDGNNNGDINTTGLGNCDANPDPTSGSYSQHLVVSGNTAVQSGADENNFLVLFCSNDAQVTNNVVTDTTPGDSNADTALYISGGNSGARVSNNTLDGGGSTDATGISLNSQFYDVLPGYAATTISENTIDGWNNGIRITGGTDGYWSNVTIAANHIAESAVDGITVGQGNTGNSFLSNNVSSSAATDCVDATTGTGTALTANTWTANVGSTSTPAGLCNPAPVVTSISPVQGPTVGGTTVTITGSGFTAATAVDFGATPALSFTVVSATAVTAVAPPGASGLVDVTVTSATGTSATGPGDQFRYVTSGYDLVGSDGGVFVFPLDQPGFHGSLPGLGIHVGDVVGIVSSADDQGYYLVGGDGGVFSFGDTTFVGSLPGIGVRVSDIVGIVPTANDRGYLLVGRDGGVFSFGQSGFEGSLPGLGIHVDDIVGIAATPGGLGYWLVGANGAVFAFGDAKYLGAPSTTPQGVTGIAATPSGHGYWIVTANGSVYPFGDAPFSGSLPVLGVAPNRPVVTLVPTVDGGYWLVATDGGVFAFGNARYEGSLPGLGISVNDVVGGSPTAG